MLDRPKGCGKGDLSPWRAARSLCPHRRAFAAGDRGVLILLCCGTIQADPRSNCVLSTGIGARQTRSRGTIEAQTVRLLSLQPIPQEVFDCQVAFNMVDRWGPDSAERLADARAVISQEVQQYLAGRAPVPAINLIQAPVFYGHAFAAFAEFEKSPDAAALAERFEAAGFQD